MKKIKLSHERDIVYVSSTPKDENPLESIKSCMISTAKDNSLDKRDAWMYGIVVGWDQYCYKELQRKHGWPDSEVERNKRLHNKYQQLLKEC